jgi:hypothetical protein
VCAVKIACMTRGKDKAAIDQIFKAPAKPSGKVAAQPSTDEPGAKKAKKETTQKASEAAAGADAEASPARRSTRARK